MVELEPTDGGPDAPLEGPAHPVNRKRIMMMYNTRWIGIGGIIS
jgi:hypothetical protein